MSEWKTFFLEDFAEIHNAKRIPLSSMERSKRKGIYPYYGASGIVDYIDDFKLDGEYVLISEDGENLRTRNTSIAFKASGKFWVNNHAHIVKGKKKLL
jgi:type I restriction enzyme S subunit